MNRLDRLDILDMEKLLTRTDEVEALMKQKGGKQGDVQWRFKSLVDVMKRNRMDREFVQVAYLFRYVSRDMIPTADRDKSMYHFIQRAIKNYSDEKNAAAFLKVLEDIKEGRALQEENLKKVREKLFKGLEDKTAKAL